MLDEDPGVFAGWPSTEDGAGEEGDEDNGDAARADSGEGERDELAREIGEWHLEGLATERQKVRIALLTSSNVDLRPRPCPRPHPHPHPHPHPYLIPILTLTPTLTPPNSHTLTLTEQILVLIAWTNCHEHALVNTFEAMGDAAHESIVSNIGKERLCELASIQSGKAYSADTKKVSPTARPAHRCS